MLADREYPKAAIRLFRNTLNTIIYVIPKYLYYARLAKRKALAVPRLISREASLNISSRISKAISYTTIRLGINTI